MLRLSVYRREVLQRWKSKTGLKATYRHLLQICVAAEYATGAGAICKVLQEKGNSLL